MHPSSHRVGVALATRVALCLAVHGCTTVDGGAVELSWKLRGASGSPSSFIDCNANGVLTDTDGPITGTGRLVAIEIRWNEAGLGSGAKTFSCHDGHGVTGFELPPGEAALTVSPVCLNGPANSADYTAPAPELRTVTAGNTVSLGAVELVLQVDCELQHCICQ